MWTLMGLVMGIVTAALTAWILFRGLPLLFGC